jgi:hypothetical protein
LDIEAEPQKHREGKNYVAKEWLGKHVPAATEIHPTIEELLEVVFSMWFMPRFANRVKYLSIICDKRFIWRMPINVIKTKAFGTFIRMYSLFKTECLNTD